MKEGKIWGTTTDLLKSPTVEVHFIEVKPRTFCSLHKHQTKFNAFYLISGKLKIERWKNDYDLVDSTILYPGDFTVVPPGEYHKFSNLDDCSTGLEIYWSELDHNDIVRKGSGGTEESS